MLLDELCNFGDHSHLDGDLMTSFAKADKASLSTPAAVSIGAGAAGAVSVALYAAWRTVSRWSLRDSSTQVPDFDPTTTPTGSRRAGSTTPNDNYTGIHGETGDPSEFLSATPTGRVRKNTRARFF